MYISRLLVALLLAFSVAVSAEQLVLRDDHPSEYTVVRGDTLWDISGMFLRDPWLWPEIWHINQQVENPHLIYPGDVLRLVWVDGKPRLMLDRGVTKLTPQVRSTPVDLSIPPIPLERIRPFLSRNRVVLSVDAFEQAPYVVHMIDDRTLGDADTRVYVRGMGYAPDTTLNVMRAGQTYRDSQTDEVIGYEAIFIGDATVRDGGDPARVDLISTVRESRVGDRLMPADDSGLQQLYQPHAPDSEVSAHIIDVLNGDRLIGQFQIVVLDRGDEDGLEPGHVLASQTATKVVPDTVSGIEGDTVTIPSEQTGLMMVFRTFERTSFALVMEAVRPIYVGDEVVNP